MAALLYLVSLCSLALAIAYKALHCLYNVFFSPLKNVTGPTLARFTDLWYLNRVRGGQFERDNINIHRKYGPIVRYGPNRYSFDHPEAARIIYGVGLADKFAKSSFYRAFAVPNADQPSLFAHEHIKEHAQIRRLYQSTHAMSALISYEDFVDECADLFDQRLREMAGDDKSSGRLVDIGSWFQCYAFDVISMITYSKRLGFLDHGVDIAGIMASLEGFLAYASIVGIYSWIHPFLFTLRNLFASSGSGIQYVIQYTERLLKEHQSKPKNLDTENEDTQRMDFLSKYAARHRKDPATYNYWYVLSGCSSNMTAGSDTTGISLSAILFFLMKNPRVAEKLRQEIAEHQPRAADTRCFSFKETQEMQYLQAVLKEALRLHPAVGLPLERVVPKGGATIAGQFFPEGTIVGVNTWVEHANPVIFGPDPEVFRPERWIESDKQKLDAMNRHWMPFGMGARTCIGRHVSTMEISKLIPRIVRDFDFTFPGNNVAAGELKTNNRWFVKPKGFKVHITASANSIASTAPAKNHAGNLRQQRNFRPVVSEAINLDDSDFHQHISPFSEETITSAIYGHTPKRSPSHAPIAARPLPGYPDHQDPIPSRRRVAQACRACNTSKVRCDGQRPCRRCRRQHNECHYAPHPKRKASEASLDRPLAQPKTAKATNSPRSPLSPPMAVPNSASGVTRAGTHAVPGRYQTSLPRRDNMPPIEPLLETSESSSQVNHAYVPFDVGDVFLDFHPTNNTATPSLFPGDTLESHNWLDYNINETFMSFLLQDDPSLEAINNRGLDQAELGCLLPTALSDPPVSATMAQSDVAELYSRSHSPAIDQDAVEPRQYHPVSIEVDAQLIFPDMTQVPTEDVDQENLAHVDEVSDDLCDKMTQAATELQSTAYFPPFMHLRIPPGPIVNAWVQLYFEYFHPVMPILHKATFSSPKRHWLLVFTVAAIGAQFSDMKESLACSRAMHELVRRKTSSMCEQLNSVARELWMTQSILLNHIGLMYAGERRSLELAEILQALLTTLGRKKRLFTDMFPIDKFSKLQLPLTQKWQIWLLDEERRRAGFAIWVSLPLELPPLRANNAQLLDSAYDSHFDLSRLMKLSELQISLPQPDGRWGASTAQTWAGFPSLEANSLPTMEKLIASNAWKSVWPQANTLGKQVILQHLTDIIKDQNATQFGVPGFSDHDKLLAANVLTELLALEDNENIERSIDEVKSATTHQIITLSALTMHNTPTPNLLFTVVQFIYGKLETAEWARLRDKWSAFSTQGRLGCFYAARILQVSTSRRASALAILSLIGAVWRRLRVLEARSDCGAGSEAT
ncbi:hypothetical protein FDECE_15971 [Fusarium decemcellulare]|nr:hypothetical protein FDECE_15971 [Fusarium decemcellulare]